MLPTLADLQVRPNDPNLAGCEASKSRLFGLFNRYKIAAVHSRFESVVFFVTDAERLDDLGLPTVVRLTPSFEAALAGLEG